MGAFFGLCVRSVVPSFETVVESKSGSNVASADRWQFAPPRLAVRTLRILRAHRMVILAVAAYSTIAYAFSFARGEELIVPWQLGIVLPMAATIALFALAVHAAYILVVVQPARPLKYLQGSLLSSSRWSES
jgi:hypothetical protein